MIKTQRTFILLLLIPKVLLLRLIAIVLDSTMRMASAILIYNIVTITLYFVRSGYIYIINGRLRNAAEGGWNWSSLAASKIWNNAGLGAYDLGLGVDSVTPSSGPFSRHAGFPLRCLLNRP